MLKTVDKRRQPYSNYVSTCITMMMITVILIYLKYFVKQAMEACYFVASSEGSQPTLI
jgi:hypothetical protein